MSGNVFKKDIKGKVKRGLAVCMLLALAVTALSSCRLRDAIEEVIAGIGVPSENSGVSGGIIVNEVVSSNSGSYTHPVYGNPDWIELYNPGLKAADISGMKLSDSASMANAFVMPEGTVVEPKGYLTVLCDSAAAPQPGELLASFNISRSGEKLYLETPGGSVSEFAVPQLAQDISYARGEDGKYGFSPQPSFCAANGPVYPSLAEALQHGEHPDALRINELVPGSEGWVEIKNVSGETVSCSAYYLSDDAGTPFKWHFPETELGPNALLTVELNGRDTSAPLAASFKVSRSENALYIFNEAGDRVDSFTFETPVPEGVSVVAAEGGVAYTSRVTKGEENSEYTFDSLEWNEIEVDRELYINEVLPGNKYGLIDSYGDRSDWVELKNPLDVPVELDRYYLSDDPEEPLKWRLPKVALLPGKYALIFLSGRGTEGDYPAEIHAPFSLSGGESIVLSTLDGMRTQSIEIPEDLPSNVSIGRNGAGELRYYTAPTPGAPNSTHALDQYADAGLFDPDSVYISEVCAVSPARSGGSDWVELKNGSGNTVSLAGWKLTDDIDEPNKFTFGSRSISSGGYTVVTCSDTAKAENGSAPFSVSNSGETLFLIDPNGAVRDVFETGVTQVGVTSGRANGSEDGARCFFETATKGAKNASPLTGVTAEPTFSSTKLYCSSAFELTISCSTPGAQIRYTTDGSVPNKNSKLYSGPITVSENKVFHAVAYLDGFTKSPMAVKTFIFDPEYTMPVVSISLSSSDYSRMYVAKAKPNGGVTKGDEVACYMEYYVDGRLAISSGAGVRVSGASTAVYPQKSLGLYFRSGYGRSSLDYPLFEGCDVTSFRSLTLRNGGQDAYYARMRDSYMSRICQGMDIDVAYFRPVIVYINGNYRGIYDMKENLNEDYLVSHYGIIRSTAEIGSRNGYMLAGTKDLWSKMRGMCQTLDFSKQENFDKLAQLVDTDCVIDYLVARTYFYDGDMFNQKYWHTTDNKIKWRPVFFDSDYAMMGNYLGGNILGLYFNKEGFKTFHGSIVNMDIFCALNQNKAWRERFITRYIYVTKHIFNKENALKIFDKLVAEYKPEMKKHISRWGMPSSYSKWETEVSDFRNCVEKRADHALRNLKNFYHLTDEQFKEYEKKAENMKWG